MAYSQKQVEVVGDFLFEVGMMSQTPRTGFQFFGTQGQSLADHILRMIYICQVLSEMEGGVDFAQCVQMCLVHDLGETRTGDLNYIYKQYVTAKESQAVEDIVSPLPFGQALLDRYADYKRRDSNESKLVKDADNLELLLSLKERIDLSDERIKATVEDMELRLSSPSAHEIFRQIIVADASGWWKRLQRQQWAIMDAERSDQT